MTVYSAGPFKCRLPGCHDPEQHHHSPASLMDLAVMLTKREEDLLAKLRARPSPSEEALRAVPWRCFHCDEVFTDRALAQEHFAIEGVPPMCVDPLTKDEKARMVVIRRLEAELAKWRKENEQLDHEAGAYHAMTAELGRYFGTCGGVPVKTASQAYLVYEAVIGRAEAAEAKLAALSSSAPVSEAKP